VTASRARLSVGVTAFDATEVVARQAACGLRRWTRAASSGRLRSWCRDSPAIRWAPVPRSFQRLCDRGRAFLPRGSAIRH